MILLVTLRGMSISPSRRSSASRRSPLSAAFFGKEELSEEYERRARSFAEAFQEKTGGGILPLAYGEKGTFSIKYNILFDKLFGFPSSGRTSAKRRLLITLKNQTATVFLSTRARTIRRRTGSCGQLRSQTRKKSAKSCMRPCLPISKGRLPAFPSAIGTIRRAAISCISSTVRSWAGVLHLF